MAMPRVHALVGLAAGAAVWALTRRPGLAALIVASSVAIDADHLVDVAYARRRGDPTRTIVPLHSIEAIALGGGLAALARRPWLAAVVGGALLHLLTDAATMPGRWSTFWLVGRLRRRFRTRPAPPAAARSWRHRLGGTVPGDWRHQPVWRWF